MSEPTIDQKIELLVRSVLAAVDQRLNDVRDEMHAMAADVERRHQQVLQQLHDLDQRIDSTVVETRQSAGGPDPLAARMEQATQVLLERIEAMHQRNTMATNERFSQLNAAIQQLGGGTGDMTLTTVPSALNVLEGVNAPLRLMPITSQQPILAPAPTAQAPAAMIPPAAPVVDVDDGEQLDDEIDFDRLADLLSERLGHLSLPPRPS